MLLIRRTQGMVLLACSDVVYNGACYCALGSTMLYRTCRPGSRAIQCSQDVVGMVMICHDMLWFIRESSGFTWFYMVLPCFTLFYQCSAASICQRSGAKVYGQLLVTILVACQNLVHLDASRNARAQRKSEWILKQYLKHNETHWESFQETSSHGFICWVVARWPITA